MSYPYKPVLDLTDPAVILDRMAAARTARQGGWFWLPCPLCGMQFGGHEWLSGDSAVRLATDPEGQQTGICPPCTLLGRAADYRARQA